MPVLLEVAPFLRCMKLTTNIPRRINSLISLSKVDKFLSLTFDCSVAEEDELCGCHGGRGHQAVGQGRRQEEDDQGKW